MQDTVADKPIEFEFDFHQARLDDLLDGIDHSMIAEVWEVQSIEHMTCTGQHVVLLENGYHLCTCILLFDSGIVCRHWFGVLIQSEKAHFHISLIPRRWFKDDMMEATVSDEPFVKGKPEDEHSVSQMPSFPEVAESWNMLCIESPMQTAAKAAGRKQATKGTLLGLARKCVELVNYDDPGDPNTLMQMFKEWICAHEEFQRSKEQDCTSSGEDILVDLQHVQNPLRHVGKGRPAKRRIKSASEQTKKDGLSQSAQKSTESVKASGYASRHCSVCQSMQHDKRNCPDKQKSCGEGSNKKRRTE